MQASRQADATTRLVVVCNQRPLCRCPTLTAGHREGGSKLPVWVRPGDTVRQVKVAIQEQLSRSSATNLLLLDPARQVLYDPDEGHELQDHMPHGFRDGVRLRLALRRLEPPPLEGPPPWNKAFTMAKCLTTRTAAMGMPDRPIRDVALETSVFKQGGTPELASGFAREHTALLDQWAEAEISGAAVPDKEWAHVDRAPGHTAVYSRVGAPAGALQLARATRRARR